MCKQIDIDHTDGLSSKVKYQTFPAARQGSAWGNCGIVPLSLKLGTKWRWVISFTTRPLYPRWKELVYPSNIRLGGLQSRSGCPSKARSEKSRPCRGIESQFLGLSSLITILSDMVRAYKILVRKPEDKSPRGCPTLHGNSIITNVRTCRTHWSRESQGNMKCGIEITGFTEGGIYPDSYYHFLKKTDKQLLNRPPDCNTFVVTGLTLQVINFKLGHLCCVLQSYKIG